MVPPGGANPLWHVPAPPPAADSGTAWPGPSEAHPPVRARPLTRAERNALAVLRACGAASLRDDVSRTEIQRAYRMLAKRFHPDCHPGCSPRESARLAEIFATVTAAYRTLAARGPALQG